MPAIVRVGDAFSGVCLHPDHVIPIPMAGTVADGSPDAFFDGSPVAFVGSMVIGACGHVGTVVGGSPDMKCNSRSVARVGDPVSGLLVGTLVAGSPDANANG